MIFTTTELSIYRVYAGLQIQYAQNGDMHKVMELQIKLEQWIQGCAMVKIDILYKEKVNLSWSPEARAQFRKLCADGIAKANDGFEQWVLGQHIIERWVSDYIQQAIFQATIKFKN